MRNCDRTYRKPGIWFEENTGRLCREPAEAAWCGVSRCPLAGGAEGARTPDLLNAIEALSHLSYGPARDPSMATGCFQDLNSPRGSGLARTGTDLEDLGAANRASALGRRSAILHRYLLSVLDLTLRLALHAICVH